MKYLSLFLCLFLATGSSGQDLTDATAVVNKYLTAIGGREKLETVKDLIISTTADMQGRTMEMETKLKMPDKFKQGTYMMGNEVGGSVYDGATLSRSMRGQQTTKTGKEAFQEFLQNHPFPELYYDTLGIEKKLAGVVALDGGDAYDVEYSGNGTTWHEYFDKASGLKVKRTATMESPRGKSEVEVRLGDYKAVNGILFPFSRTQKFGQFEMTMETQSVKVNKGVDDKQFKIK
ncbi:hypothetical protein [Arundinibacter roseus]|uniref:Outer membrane lipoprotein-sorting protein n=1 Tax=Arundinibacter roseus TaxID=2070510 RepID=A0A4R4K377_9BACT|nr:hypothetical protein [Arundinibacter roseus]TDB61760.1 hypothetical protein EZE20_18595 [Arundinibacter roseus]